MEGDSILNGVTEERLNVEHKVKIENFPGIKSDKIFEKLENAMIS